MNDFSRWVEAIATTANVVCVLWLWRASRALASRRELQQIHERVTLLERDNQSRPGWDAFSSIKEQLGKIEGDLKALNATLRAHTETESHLRDSVDSIQRYLLENNK